MTWARTKTAITCGYCGMAIPVGEVVALFTPARKPRCVACAGTPPPALDPLPQPEAQRSTWVPSAPGQMERLVSRTMRERFEAWRARMTRGAA